MVALSDVKAGFSARIHSLKDSALKNRLLSMGLTRGTTVEVMKKAPLGGPIAIRVRDYTLCLRKEDAELIEVTLK